MVVSGKEDGGTVVAGGLAARLAVAAAMVMERDDEN